MNTNKINEKKAPANNDPVATTDKVQEAIEAAKLFESFSDTTPLKDINNALYKYRKNGLAMNAALVELGRSYKEGKLNYFSFDYCMFTAVQACFDAGFMEGAMDRKKPNCERG